MFKRHKPLQWACFRAKNPARTRRVDCTVWIDSALIEAAKENDYVANAVADDVREAFYRSLKHAPHTVR